MALAWKPGVANALAAHLGPLPSQMRDFFTQAGHLSLPEPSQRGFVVAVAKIEGRPITDANGMIAVFPDIHLHAYHGQPVDRFQYAESPGVTTLTSLDQELRAALDLCAELGVATVQAGDMYEVWEVETLLRLHYKELLDGRQRMRDVYPNARLREDNRYQIETGRILRRNILLTSTSYWRDHPLHEFSHAHIDREGIDFRSTDDICSKIRSAHATLFGRHTGAYTPPRLA